MSVTTKMGWKLWLRDGLEADLSDGSAECTASPSLA
jgi:hypothetical protein